MCNKIKSRRVRWEEHVARVEEGEEKEGKKKNEYAVLLGSLKERETRKK
jgi:hypothetical protein